MQIRVALNIFKKGEEDRLSKINNLTTFAMIIETVHYAVVSRENTPDKGRKKSLPERPGRGSIN